MIRRVQPQDAKATYSRRATCSQPRLESETVQLKRQLAELRAKVTDRGLVRIVR